MADNIRLQNPDFRDRLQIARDHANLTKSELADRAGLSYRTVHELERGTHDRAQEKTLRLLAEALDVSYAFLVGSPPETGSRPPRRRRPSRWYWLALLPVLGMLFLGIRLYESSRYSATAVWPYPHVGLRVETTVEAPVTEDWAWGLQEIIGLGLQDNATARLLPREYLEYRVERRLREGGRESERTAWEGVVRELGGVMAVTVSLPARGDSLVRWRIDDYTGTRASTVDSLQADQVRELGERIVADLLVRLRTAGPEAGSTDRWALPTSHDQAFTEYVAGTRAARREEWAEAAEHFLAAAELDPEFALAWMRAGRSLVLGGSNDEARHPLNRAWKQRAKLRLCDRFWCEALLLASEGKMGGAVQVLDEALVRWPDDKDLIDNALRAYVQWGLEWRGAEVAAAGLEQYPGDPNILIYRSFCLAQLGECGEAYRLSAKLVRAVPDNSEAWVQHAHNALRLAENDSALVFAQRGLELDPEGVWPQIRMAVVRLRRGEVNEAVAWEQHIIARDDLTPRMRVSMSVNLAAILMRSGRIQEAERVLAAQVDLLNDEDSRLEYLRGQLQLGQAGRDTVAMRQAIDDMGHLTIRRGKALHHYWTGVLDLRAGDHSQAREELGRIQDEFDPSPNDPRVGYRRLSAMIALAEGDPGRALAELERIPGYLGEWGWAAMQPLHHPLVVEVLLACGDLEGALKAQEAHARRCGYSGEAYLDLARLYERSGRCDESKAALARALDVWRHADPGFDPETEARVMEARYLSVGVSFSEEM